MLNSRPKPTSLGDKSLVEFPIRANSRVILRNMNVRSSRSFGAATILLPLVLLASALAQSESGALLPRRIYYSSKLGLRYKPTDGMLDETEGRRADIRTRAAERHTSEILDLLLAMSSGPSPSASDWHSLTIETYPRERFSDVDDTAAEAKMSAWVAGISGSPGAPRFVVLSGQKFAVYVFAAQEGTVRKGAVVWTTIRKGKLLSFAFVANSPQQLKALAESMKTVQFF